MAFLDKLGEIAKSAAEKANDGLEINRINGDISVQEGNITAYQRALGLYYWEKFLAGEILEQEPMEICEKIVMAQQNIASYQTEIAKIKADRQAEKEQRLQQKKAEQCEKEQQSETITCCSHCGAVVQQGQNFCTNCGNSIIK